jgi:hypothetical protein
MAWIKRNLIFVISLAMAVLLLAAAVFYDFTSLGHNSTAKDKLNEIYGSLQRISSNSKYLSSDGKIDNVKAASDQTAEVNAWRKKAGDYFKPIASIPNSPKPTSEAFAAALRRTIDQLQREAVAAGVELPPKYSFSFEAQHSTVKFAAGSLEPLAVQLGEVKTISEILYAARVNSFDGVQRIRVSDDDTGGPQADYISGAAETNTLAVLTPYAITFRSFSGELATVLDAFKSSPHGFIVKGINISPAAQVAQNEPPAAVPAAPTGAGRDPYARPIPTSPPPPALTGRGGLPTVLNEKLLRVTMDIEIVKLLPKK